MSQCNSKFSFSGDALHLVELYDPLIFWLCLFLTFSLYCDLVLDIFGFLQLCEVFLAQDVGLYAPKVL